jgi:predicted nucleotidyltransferase
MNVNQSNEDSLFGLEVDDLNFLKECLHRHFKNLQTRGRVWVFGSRAMGTHQRFSDVDLLIELNNASNTAPDELIANISVFLEESDFVYKVDLVLSHRLEQSYKIGVDKTKKLLLDI